MITIVAQCRLKPGRKADFLTAAAALIQASRQEPGNASYQLYEDLNDPNVVTFLEEWKSAQAIEEHNASPHFQQACTRFAPCLDGGLTIHQYRNTGL